MIKLKPHAAFLVALLIFALGIAVTSAAGLYQTKTTKTPGKIDVAGYTEQNDPADIRGSYTFADVSRLYNVPIEDLSAAFGLGGGAAAMKVNAIETLYKDSAVEIGTSSVRLFVAYYLDLPYEAAEDAFLPAAAAEVLINKGVLSPERKSYVESHAFPPE